MDGMKNKAWAFFAFLVRTAVDDPRTPAILGSVTRKILLGAGVLLAGSKFGSIADCVASNADWCLAIGGSLAAALSTIWGVWQKFDQHEAVTNLKTNGLELADKAFEMGKQVNSGKPIGPIEIPP